MYAGPVSFPYRPVYKLGRLLTILSDPGLANASRMGFSCDCHGPSVLQGLPLHRRAKAFNLLTGHDASDRPCGLRPLRADEHLCQKFDLPIIPPGLQDKIHEAVVLVHDLVYRDLPLGFRPGGGAIMQTSEEAPEPAGPGQVQQQIQSGHSQRGSQYLY